MGAAGKRCLGRRPEDSPLFPIMPRELPRSLGLPGGPRCGRPGLQHPKVPEAAALGVAHSAQKLAPGSHT